MRPDLEAIRARCEAASGPAWTWEVDDRTTSMRSSVSRIISMDAMRDRRESRIETSARLPYIATVYSDADTAFIAAARTDIPALLAYVDHLEVLRAHLNELCEFVISRKGQSFGGMSECVEKANAMREKR